MITISTHLEEVMAQPITGTVLELLTGIVGTDLTGAQPETTLDDLGLDSLVLVELAVLLRQRLGIPITHDELSECDTVGEVAALVGDRAGAAA